MKKCEGDHEELHGQLCSECNLEVDDYGNTEAQFDNCCFPDCGCDGARLCMAPSGANYCSMAMNIERGSLP